MEPVFLRDVLLALSTYLAAEVSYWIMEKTRLKMLPPERKRYLALVMSFAIACAAWLGQIGMLYTPAPETTREWIEGLFAVGATAAGIGQLLHGARVLRYK